MRQESGGERAFLLAHLRLSVVLYALGGLASLCYLAATPDGPNRPALVALVIASPLFASGVVYPLRGPILESPSRMRWLYAWSALTFFTIGVVVTLDDGIGSPLLLLLFVALQFVAMGYAPTVVCVFSVGAVAEVLAISLLHSQRSTGSVLATAGIVGMAGVLGVGASRNRARQQQAQERLAARLSFLARHDPLTGCLNRRSFDEALQAEFAQAGRAGRTVGLLLVDVDEFKQINDSYGHQVGDQALVEVARALAESVRQGDAVARIGGDEFAVVLRDVTGAELDLIRTRLRERLGKTELPARIEVSVGGAVSSAKEGDEDALLRCADTELYRDKGSRRGRRAHRSAKT